MTRRYDEPITVSLRSGPVGPDPQTFTWRGRQYAVCAIHERWAQRRSWWRDSELDPAQVAVEQRVWRVEACRVQRRAHEAVIGVFELGFGGVIPKEPLSDNVMRDKRSLDDGAMPGSGWLLLRAED